MAFPKISSFFLLAFIISLFSCTSYIRYMKNSDITHQDTLNYPKNIPEEYRLQPGDILSVQIYTYNEDINEIMTIGTQQQNFNQQRGGQNMYYTGYMLNDSGFIRLPVIGDVNVNGNTLPECRQTVQHAAEKFFVSPIVVVKSTGINIACMGEFNGQGMINIPREQIDIYDAISYAGGLSEYADKKNIKVIRNEQNRYREYLVDLTDPRTLTTKKFYVYNNDKIIADPVKSKILRRNIQEFTFFLSVITSTITTAILIINLQK